MADGPTITDTGQRKWTNKHDTFTVPLEGLFDADNGGLGENLPRYVAMTAEIGAFIDKAVQDGAEVRALGAGWSFSRAAVTSGRLLNTKGLNLSFSIAPALVAPGYPGDRDGLRFVQCGNSVSALNKQLKREGRSLRTTGASNGQTIVGVSATGSHGSAIDIPPVADFIVALHVVLGAGRHVWLERASYPVVTDAFIKKLGAEPLRDDAAFNAALVGLGSFGFVHGAVIETEPIFLLEMHRHRMPLDTLDQAINELDFDRLELPGGAERPFHFQVLVNPYDMAKGVHVVTMYKRPYRTDYTPPDRKDGIGPGDDALAFLGTLTDAAPKAIPPLINALMGKVYSDSATWPVTGTIGEIFTNTDTRGKAAGLAMGIPAARSREALDLVLELNRTDGPYPCLVALRYVRKTSATLGFTRWDRTCVVDLDGVLSHRMLDYYRKACDLFTRKGIPFTLHWGKVFVLDGAGVRAAYGDAAVQSWVGARARLLSPELRKAFSNQFLVDVGLSA